MRYFELWVHNLVITKNSTVKLNTNANSLVQHPDTARALRGWCEARGPLVAPPVPGSAGAAARAARRRPTARRRLPPARAPPLPRHYRLHHRTHRTILLLVGAPRTHARYYSDSRLTYCDSYNEYKICSYFE